MCSRGFETQTIRQEATKHTEVDTKNVGIELPDVQSAVNELRLCYAEWFNDMKPERKKEIMSEVFGVKE